MPPQIIEIPGVGQVEFPDGMSDSEISAAAAKLYQEASADSGPKMGFGRALLNMAGEVVKNNPVGMAAAGNTMMREMPEGVLPTLGALGGGMLGNVPGAAVGAAVGGALERGAKERPVTLSNVAMDAASGAAGQAAGPIIGRLVRGGARMAGRTLVRGAVRPSAALKREFGGGRAIADTILDEATPTSGVAGLRLDQSARALDDLIAGATPTATPIQAAELLDDLTPVVERATMRGRLGMAVDDPLEQLARMERANPNGIRLNDAQDLKREAQGVASRVYKARAMGQDVNNISAETNEAVASGLRRAIEKRVPEAGPINQRTQRLMGAERALREAEDRPNAMANMLALLAGAKNPAAGVALRSLNSGRIGSAAGIAIDRAGQVVGNPTVNRAAVLAALLSGE